jgi:AraC-like DNA-binding protein
VAQRLGNLAVHGAGGARFPARGGGYHAIDRDETFGALDCVCQHGVTSPRTEGSYAGARIGVILGGAFHARSRQGSAMLGAGALLLGNAGADYEYRHVDDGGDRSLVFAYDEAALEPLGRAGFRRACVPASARSASAVVLAYHALWSAEPEAIREAALAVLDVAIAADGSDRPATLTSEAQRPISQALRYIDAHAAEDCSLAVLAAQAGLSSFHFVRRFRATTGQTPRQVVIATRLRAAATRLRATCAPVLDVALDVGFGDLSHFTTSFTRAFGVSPARYRRG